MEFSVQERGKYLRGMLLLIGKDQQILEHEKNWFYRLSKILGYDIEFCRTAIKELPENEYLETSPPKFSYPEVARAFIIDGIHLAYADAELHPKEMLWINAVAAANGIDNLWAMNEHDKFMQRENSMDESYPLEIEKVINR